MDRVGERPEGISAPQSRAPSSTQIKCILHRQHSCSNGFAFRKRGLYGCSPTITLEKRKRIIPNTPSDGRNTDNAAKESRPSRPGKAQQEAPAAPTCKSVLRSGTCRQETSPQNLNAAPARELPIRALASEAGVTRSSADVGFLVSAFLRLPSVSPHRGPALPLPPVSSC